MKKLSEAQLRVLTLMADGWELGLDISGLGGHAWLQRGGCGRGGESVPVRRGTLASLAARGLIVTVMRKFPLHTYGLTVAGRLRADLATRAVT